MSGTSKSSVRPSKFKLRLRSLSLWNSFVHSCLALVVIPLAYWSFWYPLLSDAASESAVKSHGIMAWLWHAVEASRALEPSTSMYFLTALGGLYYALDFVGIWCNLHPVPFSFKCWYSFHHLLCMTGLVVPCWLYRSGLDTSLAFGGYFLGEMSNPPRCITDLIRHAVDIRTNGKAPGILAMDSHMHRMTNGPSPKADDDDAPPPTTRIPIWWLCGSHTLRQLQHLVHNLQLLHVVLFLAFRFIGVHYFVSIVWPHASTVTIVTGGLTLLLSIGAVMMMLDVFRHDASPPTIRMDHASERGIRS